MITQLNVHGLRLNKGYAKLVILLVSQGDVMGNGRFVDLRANIIYCIRHNFFRIEMTLSQQCCLYIVKTFTSDVYRCFNIYDSEIVSRKCCSQSDH